VRVLGQLKTWAPIFLSLIAVALSGYAVYIDNAHYQELTKPHTQHDEIYSRLVRLDAKIERIAQAISVIRQSGQETVEATEKLEQAKSLRDRAELAWDSGHYTDTDAFIVEAHRILEEIRLPPVTVMNWWLIGGTIAGLAVISVLVSLAVRHKRSV
jgi:hypothetical protein